MQQSVSKPWAGFVISHDQQRLAVPYRMSASGIRFPACSRAGTPETRTLSVSELDEVTRVCPCPWEAART